MSSSHSEFKTGGGRAILVSDAAMAKARKLAGALLETEPNVTGEELRPEKKRTLSTGDDNVDSNIKRPRLDSSENGSKENNGSSSMEQEVQDCTAALMADLEKAEDADMDEGWTGSG